MAALVPTPHHSPLEVADTIAQLGSAMSAVHREQLRWVALADFRQDWREDGARDMAQWLCARLGLGQASAREWGRVAHALGRLPAIAGAYPPGPPALDQFPPP